MGKGLHEHRFKNNPEEKRFAEAWAKEPNILPAILGDGVNRAYPSERDEQVAATMMQWLGSPVGQGFLRGLGYSKNKSK